MALLNSYREDRSIALAAWYEDFVKTVEYAYTNQKRPLSLLARKHLSICSIPSNIYRLASISMVLPLLSNVYPEEIDDFLMHTHNNTRRH
jgi:hypothetical protein